MEVYVKKYAWVVSVLVVMLCAVFAAKAMNHVVAARYLSEVSEPPPRKTKVSSSKSEAARSKVGAPFAKRNMFCHTCEPPLPEEGTGDTATGDGTPITSLPLHLVATNVSLDPKNSFATIENTSSNKRGYYAEGDEMPDAGKVVSIRGRYMDFRNKSSRRLERVELLSEKAASKPKTTPFKTTKRSSSKPKNELEKLVDEGVKKTGDTSWDIEGSLVAKVLENPASVGRGARIVPSIRNGKPNGFKLYAIRPNSVFAKIGLKNGDTIQAVNGFELTTLDAAFEVYTKVKDANSIALKITRRGKPVNHSYSIRR